MNIELKNIKHSDFASQETYCYEATLYVNGKRASKHHWSCPDCGFLQAG